MEIKKVELYKIKESLSVVGQKDENPRALDFALNFSRVKIALAETDSVIDTLKERCLVKRDPYNFMVADGGGDYVYKTPALELEFRQNMERLLSGTVEVDLIQIPTSAMKEMHCPSNALTNLLGTILVEPMP